MRAALILVNEEVRARAAHWVRTAPDGTRMELKAPRRTLDQNSKLWACLTDVSKQVEHMGRKYDPERWKLIFMHALGREIEFLPSLDGASFIPCGGRSSDMTKQEMSDLIEYILAWGAQNGVSFHYDNQGQR